MDEPSSRAPASAASPPDPVPPDDPFVYHFLHGLSRVGIRSRSPDLSGNDRGVAPLRGEMCVEGTESRYFEAPGTHGGVCFLQYLATCMLGRDRQGNRADRPTIPQDETQRQWMDPRIVIPRLA